MVGFQPSAEFDMVSGIGCIDRFLSETEIRNLVKKSLAAEDLDGKKVLVLIPDQTRTAPIPLFFNLLFDNLGARVRKLDYLVALGTHKPHSEEELCQLAGITAEEKQTTYSDVDIFNHEWSKPETFWHAGTISIEEASKIIGSRLDGMDHDAGLLRDIPVRLNRMVLDYDHLIICGPTFPHEVVGFSGGNKYFFPGIGGSEIINYSHWLGAVISSYKIIGTKYTAVRQIIDLAAQFINIPRSCFSLVVTGDRLSGLYYGSPEDAYEKAADLSSAVHIKWLDKPVSRVLSVMPTMYKDIWTAAKGMYKLDPAIADGGEVIIYAPHIDEVSYSHGDILDEVGYHVCDFFLKQWDSYRDYPGGVLAHSTHVKGLGEYDAETGTESPRIKVTLATGISEEHCRKIGLGYCDPATIDPETWASGGSGWLMVPRAGETLYRVRHPGN